MHLLSVTFWFCSTGSMDVTASQQRPVLTSLTSIRQTSGHVLQQGDQQNPFAQTHPENTGWLDFSATQSNHVKLYIIILCSPDMRKT